VKLAPQAAEETAKWSRFVSGGLILYSPVEIKYCSRIVFT